MLSVEAEGGVAENRQSGNFILLLANTLKDTPIARAKTRHEHSTKTSLPTTMVSTMSTAADDCLAPRHRDIAQAIAPLAASSRTSMYCAKSHSPMCRTVYDAGRPTAQ